MERDLTINLNLRRDQAERASAEFHRAERQRIGDLVTEAKAAEQKRVEHARDALGRFVSINREASAAARRSADEVTAGWSRTNTLIRGAAGAVTSFAGQMIGLSSAQSALTMLLDHWDKLRKSTLDAAEQAVKYKDVLQELAALKGTPGGTTGELREQLAFRGQTLQTADAARRFQEMAMGAGESAITQRDRAGRVTRQGIIEQAEFRRLMEMAGSFQAVEGGEAGTHGRLAGMIPMLMGRRNVTGQQAFAEEQALYNIFKPGGGTFSQMTEQFLKNAPMVTAGLTTDRRMAALLSAFSTTNPQGAGENVQQFARATVGSLGRMRGSAIEGLQEKQAEYLKRLGATDQMDMTDIGKLISADFARQEQASAARGQRFNPLTYLQQHGYQNQEDIAALMSFHGLMKTGQFANTFESLADQRVSPEQAFAPVEAARRSDQVMQQRKVDIGRQAAEVAAGERTVSYRQLMEQAYSKLKAERGASGIRSFEDYTGTIGQFTGGQNRLELEALGMLGEEFRKGVSGIGPGAEKYLMGEDVDESLVPEAVREKIDRFKRLGGMQLRRIADEGPGGTFERRLVNWEDPEARARRFEALSQLTAEVGGDKVPGLEGVTEAASKQLEATTKFAANVDKFGEYIKEFRAQNSPGPKTSPSPEKLPGGRRPFQGRVDD